LRLKFVLADLLIAGLLVLLLLLLLAIGGLMAFVIESTKESSVGEGGLMLAKNTGLPVQTANSDLAVVDGIVMTRAGADALSACQADPERQATCATPNAIKMTQVLPPHPIHPHPPPLSSSLLLSPHATPLVFSSAPSPPPVSPPGGARPISHPLVKCTQEGAHQPRVVGRLVRRLCWSI
jgi:hypothetical protein